MISFNHTPTDLKKYYTIFLELGLIGSLLIFIAATNMQFTPTNDNYEPKVAQRDVINLEDVVKTEQMEQPPAPPVPTVPVEVPNNVVIEEEILDINAEFQINEALEIPEPPRTIKMDEEPEEEDFFIAVEQMPELVGTLGELRSNLQYPEAALAAGIEGTVVVQFIVNEKGEVVNPRVIRGIGGGCDEEAMRVTKLAKFIPGRQRGVPVKVQYSLPFRFILKK